jgi:hypothetical protein
MTKYNRRTRKRTRRRRGGKYMYDLNTKPRIFTSTSQQGGDSRDTLFPSFITNMARDSGFQLHKLLNAGMGRYEPINPSPLAQNLFKR